MTDLRLDAPVVTVGSTPPGAGGHPQLRAVAGRRRAGPADRRRPGRPRAVGRPAGRRGRARRLQPALHHARRPPRRGADRRRSAAARRPSLAGRAGPRVAQRAAGRRPFQVRAVPGRDRLSGPGAGPDRGVARSAGHDPRRRSSRNRSSRAATCRPSTSWSSATSPSSARPRSPHSTTTSSRGAEWSSSAAIR